MTSSWEAAIPKEDREVYDLAGFGQKTGLGARPATLVIDVQYRTIGDVSAPIEESIRDQYRTSCGERGWTAVPNIRTLIEATRRSGAPVIYPYVAPKAAIDAGRTGEKVPALMTVPDRGYEFVQEIAPQDGDLLLPKRHPSAFFGTALTSYLVDLGVDSLLIAGCTTSGCVRASAMDAFSYNFRCAVIEDCVYDRSTTIHNVNLFDIQSKYADVLPLSDALEHLAALERRGPVGRGG